MTRSGLPWSGRELHRVTWREPEPELIQESRWRGSCSRRCTRYRAWRCTRHRTWRCGCGCAWARSARDLCVELRELLLVIGLGDPLGSLLLEVRRHRNLLVRVAGPQIRRARKSHRLRRAAPGCTRASRGVCARWIGWRLVATGHEQQGDGAHESGTARQLHFFLASRKTVRHQSSCLLF